MNETEEIEIPRNRLKHKQTVNMTEGIVDYWGKDGHFIKKLGQLAIISKNEFRPLFRPDIKLTAGWLKILSKYKIWNLLLCWISLQIWGWEIFLKQVRKLQKSKKRIDNFDDTKIKNSFPNENGRILKIKNTNLDKVSQHI